MKHRTNVYGFQDYQDFVHLGERDGLGRAAARAHARELSCWTPQRLARHLRRRANSEALKARTRGMAVRRG